MNDTSAAQSELAPWTRADLPEPPMPRGLAWLGVCGPGVIVLGVSIGSGEFLLGPATFVKHGLSLLWVTLVAVFFQTVFNTELMRYTVATGEPVVTGFMRTRPGRTFWAWFYAGLYFLQIGWPAWAATAAGAVFFLFLGRLAAPPADSMTIYLIGIATFLACVVVLLLGRRIARTLELLNWVMVVCILGGFLVLGFIYVPLETWASAVVGFFGFNAAQGGFVFLPDNVDILLLGALVGYSGGGGVLNLTLSNWARDKGYGMGARVGHISGVVGGQASRLADTGFIFEPDPANLSRWRGWWRIVRVDQWGIFFVGALLGMMLPALLYVTFVEPGTDIKGLAISAVLAQHHRYDRGAHVGPAGRGAGRVDPVQDAARLRRRHDALDHRHPVDGQRARAQLARRRRAPRVLRCARRGGGVGNHRAEAGAARRAAADRREHRGSHLHHLGAAPAVPQHAGAAEGAAAAVVAPPVARRHGVLLRLLRGAGGQVLPVAGRAATAGGGA